jgi:hypothetical protein
MNMNEVKQTKTIAELATKVRDGSKRLENQHSVPTHPYYLDLIENGIIRSKDMNIIKANETKRNENRVLSSQENEQLASHPSRRREPMIKEQFYKK